MHIPFKVYISCSTFNHAPYIKDAMDGFVMQQTSYPFIAIIMDDASTDGEPDVITNYLKEHFDLEDQTVVRHEETDDYVMTFARHKENLNCYFAVYFLKYNHYSIKKAKPYPQEWRDSASYVAVCEGDDYWTHPMKLQIQVDYLDQNPSCGIVYSIAEIYNQDKQQFEGSWGREVCIKSLYLESSPIPTLSVCYRIDLFRDYINKRKEEPSWPLGDVPLWIYFYHNSSMHFIKKKMGVYRLLSESMSHSLDFSKRTNFIYGAFKCRQFYAEKYVGKNLAKEIVEFRTENLLNLSLIHNHAPLQPLLKDLLVNYILNIRLFVLIIFSYFNFGRIIINKQRCSSIHNVLQIIPM